MGPLSGYQWQRLITVPRVSEVPDPGRWLASSITAAVVASHAELLNSLQSPDQPSGFAVAWIRPPGADRVHFLVGGRPAFPPTRDPGPRVRQGTGVPVLFPPGASAQPLGDEMMERWCEQLPLWFRCLGTTDVNAQDVRLDGVPGAEPPAGLDDYAMHISSPFAWIVAAEPVSRETLDKVAAETSARLTPVRKRESSESQRVELERGQHRLRELTRARGSGLWRVRVLAGGLDKVGARQAATLLCSAVDAAGTGHQLFPDDNVASLGRTWSSPPVNGPDHSAAPFLAGSDLVAALVRPPVRELPGIRLLAPYRFDVTPVPQAADAGVDLGHVLDEALNPVGRFTVPYSTLNRHAFVCGATGSGKSQTGRRLLEALSTGARRVPWLVIEPAKAEYAAMSGRLAGRDNVLVIQPGALHAAPASLNPLEPEPGFPLQSHADLVRALFLAAFEANEPFPQVLSHSLTECYTEAGWNLVTGRLRRRHKPRYRVDEDPVCAVPRYPTLRELQATARRVVDNIGYGKEVAADIRGFVDVRLSSLRVGAPGRFFEGGHPLDVGGLLQRNVVLELQAITNDQDKAFLMGTVLIRIVEHLRVRGPNAELGHVMLIEEAHRLLKNVHEGPAAAAVELFASLLAEIRAYGEGVVIAEQIPSKILPDVVKNTALKVMHRLPARDDRDAVGATMNLTESNSQAVVSLPPGIAAATVDGDDRPLLVAVDGGMDREATTDVRIDPPLRDRRSLLCGADCQARACTLTELDDATAVVDEPAVVVWSETVAAALVMGHSPPSPRPLVVHLFPDDSRKLDCALATLADRAVDARRTQLMPWVAPDDFADHLRGILAALISGNPAPTADPARFRAGAFRWQPVYRELRNAVRAAGTAASIRPPHPRTEAWRAVGLDLDAPSLGGQFEQLRNDPSYSQGSERVAFGDITASGLGTAVVTLGGSDTVTSFGRALLHACTVLHNESHMAAIRDRYPVDDYR